MRLSFVLRLLETEDLVGMGGDVRGAAAPQTIIVNKVFVKGIRVIWG